MATFERIGLVLQVVGNIYGLVADMRDNAAGYKSRVAAGHAIAGVAAVMQADAGLYLDRIAWITGLFTRNNTLATNALTDLGLTRADAVALRDTLRDAANHTLAAPLGTAAEINAEADWILANVPNYERIW